MNRRLWLWSLVIVLLLVSVPGLYERWSTEVENDTYEFALPFQEINDLTIDGTISLDDALTILREAGLNTVSVSPDSLNRWARQDIIDIYGQAELVEKLRFSGLEDSALQSEEGFFVTKPEDAYYDDRLKANFDTTEVNINEEMLYFIADEEGNLPQKNFGYNKKAIETIKENDLNYLLRLQNKEEQAINEQTIEQVLELKDDRFSTVLFSGLEVIGYPDIPLMKQWAEQLNEAGLNFYMIEMAHQKGLQTIARDTNYDIIRLHSLSLGSYPLNTNVDKTVRAVKERNIRTIFFHLQNGDPEESLDNAVEYLTTAQEEMPNQFQTGSPKPFEQIDVPLWMKLAVLLAGIVFSYLASGSLLPEKIAIATAVLMALVAAGFLVTGILLLLKLFALAVAIAAPIYAVASTSGGTTKLGSITLHYIKAIGIIFAGIAIVAGLLNGNAFITGFELFRGVKLVYIIPLLFFIVYALWDKLLPFFKSDLLGKMLGNLWNTKVKYGHLFIFGLVAFVGYYYISRTGNYGSVADIELIIRQKLEELLYVRPRTKEFLIGFPLYLLALYVMGINRRWGILLLIPGVIGFLSVMNTFTHLHIPLHISLLRTFYSLLIGYIIGMIMIFVFKIIYRYISKALIARWS